MLKSITNLIYPKPALALMNLMDINALSPQALSVLFIIFSTTILILGFAIGFIAKKYILIKEKEKEFKQIIASEKKERIIAQEAIRARDEFLSIVSHELKTPLTTIILRIQSTLDSILNQSLANFSGERLVKSLSVAQEQTRRLQELIKDLLNFSLITTGKLNLELNEADLNKIIKSAIDQYEDHLKLAGCKLSFKTDGKIPGLWDQIRLEQVISNLLNNAIKYGEGQPIDIDISRRDSVAIISVSDHGIGIFPEQRKTIFERFRRGVEDKKYQGLGVGLFIVKQIIDAHGGKVNVKSKLGKGSTFTLELPVVQN